MKFRKNPEFGRRRLASTLGIAAAALALLALPLTRLSASEGNDPTIWFNHPAAQWNNALPIGNGSLGAMVFGRLAKERIQFNQDTLWKGHPHDYARPDAHKYLGKIRQLLWDGKVKEAEDLARKKFLGNPVREMPYQPFGDLHIEVKGTEGATDYRRELDLASAMAKISYRVGDVRYERDAFSSYPDHVIVLRFSASKPGHVSLTLSMDSPHKDSSTRAISNNTLLMSGQVEKGGLRFESRIRVVAQGGSVSTTDKGIQVTGADSAVFVLSAETSFKNFQDISGNPDKRCADVMSRVKGRTYQGLLEAHLADYRRLFDRVTFDLGHDSRADLPTDARLALIKHDGLKTDPSLAPLYFQFGRYLLISSSRPGSQPANLQGIWNEKLNPPWESKWTTNINVEMNYWPAELTNLSECHFPLFDLIDDLTISGHRTAEENYGCKDGWVVHHNTDLWRASAPCNNIDGVWPTGGAWLCHQLWNHYLFTRDKEFLAKRAYPDMKKASEFFFDYLVRDPKTGWLVTSPSYSPEQGPLTYGPTMDNQLIRALLKSSIKAAQILGVDKDFQEKAAKIMAQLPPNQVGKYGQLQEWIKDVDVPNNNHRHMSPLWAVYPGAGITPFEPKIWKAAMKLLKWRGDGSTGWSYAWRISLWARAGNGDMAYHQLDELLQRRTLPNMLDLCGPFQIDGNFGATAGMVEMLLQSQLDVPGSNLTPIIDLLPALPKSWPHGSITGICARGGFTVDLSWDNGRLVRAVIHSKLGTPCRLRYDGKSIDLKTEAGHDYTFDGNLNPVTF